ncbi:MAG: efflux RND transporter permease subunit, partial [Calditrichia bacterium]|nr:efflux RND transporter permease subunit [Calditrichia bacterium]
MKFIIWFLHHKISVFVLLFIVIIAGFVSYVNLAVESFPQIKQPVVIVAVPYLGVAPGDMETLVAQPIENKLKEITKIKKMTSTSNEGATTLVVEFETDIDIDEAVRKVREKVDQAKPDLPNDIEEPIIQEINFENIPIMLVS